MLISTNLENITSTLPFNAAMCAHVFAVFVKKKMKIKQNRCPVIFDLSYGPIFGES